MSSSKRINGFDALRTIAMWLGVILHATIVYKATPEPNWPHDEQVNLYSLDWLYHYIHIFRMPLFFMVAGFFARFVIVKSGLRYFVNQRFKRIVVPFLFGIVVIVPVTLLPFHFFKFYYEDQLSRSDAWRHSLLQMLKWNGFAHLWFLYYLIIFYVLSVAGVFAGKKFRLNLAGYYSRMVEKISLPKVLVAVLLLFAILYFFRIFVPPVYTGIKPNLIYLLYYGFFFYTGWVLQTNMVSITSLTKNCWLLFIIGTGLSVIQFFMGDHFIPIVQYFLAAVQTISLVAGITGLFMKYCHAENKVWRYCSDAAYWVYLIHVSVVVSMQMILLHSPVVGWLRLPIVLAVTFLVSLLSYQYLVRYTIIGGYLHGKRTKPAKDPSSKYHLKTVYKPYKKRAV